MHPVRRRLSGDHRPAQRETSATTGEIFASPLRKHRRQSLPARLSTPRPQQYGGAAGLENAGTSPAPAAERAKIGQEPPSPPPLDHLTRDQKIIYARVVKVICYFAATEWPCFWFDPLPVWHSTENETLTFWRLTEYKNVENASYDEDPLQILLL